MVHYEGCLAETWPSTIQAAMEHMMQRARGGLWGRPDFVKLWIGQTISQLGSGIGGMAVSLTAVLVLGAAPAQMGILTAMGAVPVLLVGLPAGAWVDRLRRRPILIAADLGRAVLLAWVPLAWALGWLRIEQLYVVAALVGALTVVFDVADESFLPSLVPREDLVEGNSKLGVSSSVAEIGGPSLGGLLVQIMSAPLAVLFDTFSFVASAISLGAIRTVEPAPLPAAEEASLRREIGEGLRLVAGDRMLRALAGTSATFTFFGNFIGALYSLYVIRELGLSPAVLGISVGVGGIGALIGALLTGPVTRRLGLGPTLIGALTVAGLIQLLLPLIGGPPLQAGALLLAVQLLGDIAIAVFMINEISLRQALIPSALLGRANASIQFLVGGLGLFGALLAGVLAEAPVLGIRGTLLLAVLGIIAASSWMFFSPVRALRATPALSAA
ncbi:MAG TPA: MFS transporter [Chloroflexia bacterium]|nr:MFS transporter [Chloroflexia bacterium]